MLPNLANKRQGFLQTGCGAVFCRTDVQSKGLDALGTGRVREPPGLERETQTDTEDLPMKEIHETVTETQDDLRLETLETTETETRLPPETRVRNEKRTAENQELPEDLLPDDKRLTIAATGVFSVTKKRKLKFPSQ